MSNYPDDMDKFNHDPASPEYKSRIISEYDYDEFEEDIWRELDDNDYMREQENVR